MNDWIKNHIRLKLSIHQKYGIERIEDSNNSDLFELEMPKNNNTAIIYSPNGTMKTSLSKALCEMKDNEEKNQLSVSYIKKENKIEKKSKTINLTKENIILFNQEDNLFYNYEIEKRAKSIVEYKKQQLINHLKEEGLNKELYISKDFLRFYITFTKQNKEEQKILKTCIERTKVVKNENSDFSNFFLYESIENIYNFINEKRSNNDYLNENMIMELRENVKNEKIREIHIKNEILYSYIIKIEKFTENTAKYLEQYISELKKYKELKRISQLEINKLQKRINEISKVFDFNYDFKLKDGKISPIRRCNCKKCVESDHFKNLSKGEGKVIQLLNVMFFLQQSFENVKNEEYKGVPKIFVIDDIFDSFDNKNTQAILNLFLDFKKDFESINKQVCFLFLTHNTSALRLISKQFNCGRNTYKTKLKKIKCRNVIEIEKGRILEPSKDFGEQEILKEATKIENENNIDSHYEFHNRLIAAIPFIRETNTLFENKEKELELRSAMVDKKNCIPNLFLHHEKYIDLTSFLHFKEKTVNLTISDLKNCLDVSLKNENYDLKNYLMYLFNINESKTNENLIYLIVFLRLLLDMYLIKNIPVDDSKFISDLKGKNLNSNQTDKFLSSFDIHINKKECIPSIKDIDVMFLKKVKHTIDDFIHMDHLKYMQITEFSDVIYYDNYNKIKFLIFGKENVSEKEFKEEIISISEKFQKISEKLQQTQGNVK